MDTNTPHQIAQWLAELLMLDVARPRRCGRMSRPGETKRDKDTGQIVPRGKYEDLPKSAPFTLSNLIDHARARVTWSCTLDQNGLSYAGVIEIDAGGRDALLRTLAACERRGIVAFAFEQIGKDHKGGHVWFLFSEPAPTADVRALCRAITNDAGLPPDTELWPQNQGLRPPFGYHQTNQTFGNLVLQSGELIALDTELTAGFTAVRTLPRNSTPPATPVEQPNRVQSALKAAPAGATTPQHTTAGRIDTQAIGAAVRARFNQENEWADLLSNAGGTEMRDGWQCNCGYTHTHPVQLAITSRDKIISFSPNCAWAPHKESGHALDKFGFAVAQTYRGNYKAAMEALARQYGLWVEPTRQRQPEPAEPERRQQTHAQAADAARKRAERIRRASTIINDIRTRANADITMDAQARRMLEVHLQLVGQDCKHTKSVIGQAHLAGYSERNAQIGNAYLVEHGYIKRTLRGSKETALWTLLESSAHTITRPQNINIGVIPETGEGSPMYIHESDSYSNLRASEPRAQAPELPALGEADTLDTWQAVCDEHGAAELAFLDTPAAEPDAGLLSYVRGLAREVGALGYEHGWELRDYLDWNDSKLEQEVQRLEALLRCPPNWRIPGFHDAEQPELATYEPTKTAGAYTGQSKHYADFAQRWAWSNEAIRVIDAPAEVGEVEQAQLDAPPVVRPATRRRNEVSALDRYRADVALMSESQLAGEIRKHTATLKKHAGAAWLPQVRDKLAIVQAELDDRAGVPAALGSTPAPIERPRARLRAPLQARAPQRASPPDQIAFSFL